jgi:hypothetical protein
MNELFGTEAFFDDDLWKLLMRLALDLGVTSLVVMWVYYRLYKNREFVFTYYIFNIITFTMCVLLRKVPMELGFALGLFAVFGILRYRTEEIRMRDLTYMFIVIGIGIINAVANKKVSLAELLTVDAAIVGVTAIIELWPSGRGYGQTPMLYDAINLLQPGREAELHEDLTRRTGFDVVRVQLHRIDMLRDAAEITVFYRGPSTPRPRLHGG